MPLEKEVKRLSLYENSLKNKSKWKLKLKYLITIKYNVKGKVKFENRFSLLGRQFFYPGPRGFS